jgi:hypothetical protein
MTESPNFPAAFALLLKLDASLDVGAWMLEL